MKSANTCDICVNFCVNGDIPHNSWLMSSRLLSSVQSLATTSPQYAPVSKFPRHLAVPAGSLLLSPVVWYKLWHISCQTFQQFLILTFGKFSWIKMYHKVGTSLTYSLPKFQESCVAQWWSIWPVIHRSLVRAALDSLGYFVGVSFDKTLQIPSLVLVKPRKDTNKVSCRRDMTEILLKAAENTIQSINLSRLQIQVSLLMDSTASLLDNTTVSSTKSGKIKLFCITYLELYL